jgi:hypothetical protein
MCKKVSFSNLFMESKKLLFKIITHKYFNMLLDFFIHYIGFAFLGYVYQHFENNIILNNYTFSFFSSNFF